MSIGIEILLENPGMDGLVVHAVEQPPDPDIRRAVRLDQPDEFLALDLDGEGPFEPEYDVEQIHSHWYVLANGK